MKKYLFFLIACLFFHTAIINAQTTKKRGGDALIRSILQKQYDAQEAKKNAAAKTASVTAERLKSFSGFDYLDTAIIESAGKSDTGFFVYSGQRGSKFDYQLMIYNSGSTIFTSPMGYNNGITGTYFTGLTPLLHLDVMPDSVFDWNFLYTVYFGTDTMGFGTRSDYHYSGNNLSAVGYQPSPGTSGPISRTNYYYDGVPRLNSIISFSYNTLTSGWDSTSIDDYFYNTSNQIIMDSSSSNSGGGFWFENGKNIFSYDGSGNMIFYENFVDSSLHWQPNFIRKLNYNSDNTLKTDSISDYISTNGTWSLSTIDSYFYTPGISYFTSVSSSEVHLDTIGIRSTSDKHVNISGLPDTVYYRYYLTGGVPLHLAIAKKTYFIYDSFKNPTVASAYNYNITDSATGAGWYNIAPDRTFYYHYETYTTNVGVQQITSSKENISIYPNPAKNEINISRPDAVRGSYTFITLTNALGQTIRTESLPWMNETVPISLSGLTTGMYMLTIKDKDGATLAAEKIIKE